MEIKKYSSFKEIETHLEILKLEKEISFQRIIWNGQKIKESLTLPTLVLGLVASYKSMVSNTYSTILQSVIPLIIKAISNRKRGN